MPAVGQKSASGSPLSVLGFSVGEEELYRVLLRNSGLTVAAMAQILATTPARLRADVAPFVAAGLVEIDADRVVALSPDRSLSRLISDETRRLQSVHQQLEALRGLLPSLTAEHISAHAPKGTPVSVDLVEGGDVVQLIRSLSAASSGELLWFRPDQWHHEASDEIDAWVIELLRSGRRSRAIYPARVLEEAPQMVRARAEAGEHVRIVAEVPSRLSVMGDSAVLLPAHWAGTDGRRLVVRQQSIVVAMQHLFQGLWDRAMAVPGLDGQRGDDGRASDRRLLLDQLAGGAKDEQIARALGLSLRTVRRRVADILNELGVDSRFQAGVEAVRRGWI
jgi:hypothetical protein